MKHFVLLLDNDKVLMPAIKQSLEEAGYRVGWYDTVDDSRFALEKNRRLPVAERAGVVIVDLSFTDPGGVPGEEGFELLELAIMDQYLEAIVFTGTGNELKALRASRMGAFQYVRKSSDHSEYNSSVDELVKEVGLAFQCREDLIALTDAISSVEKSGAIDPSVSALARKVLTYIFHVRGRRLSQ